MQNPPPAPPPSLLLKTMMQGGDRVEVVHNFVACPGGAAFDNTASRTELSHEAESAREGYTATGACGGVAREAKVIVVGEAGVGKTSLLNNALGGKFDTSYKVTIGVDFGTLLYEVMGIPVRLTVWDTAGQERFAAVTKSYFSSTDAVVLCYDVGSPDSAQKVFTRWLPDITAALGDVSHIPFFLLGNKCDTASLVDETEIAKLAAEHRLEPYTLSVKDDYVHNFGVDNPARNVFLRLACVLTEKWLLEDSQRKNTPLVSPAASSPKQSEKVKLKGTAPYGGNSAGNNGGGAAGRVKRPGCCA